MEQYTLKQAFFKDCWVCTDNINGIFCAFEHGNFDHSKLFARHLKTEPTDDETTQKICENIIAWLKENHNEKLSFQIGE